MYTSGVSRQEEQAQLPRRYRLVVPTRTPVPPTAAEVSVPSNFNLARGNVSLAAELVKSDVTFFSRGALPQGRCVLSHQPWRTPTPAVCAAAPAVARSYPAGVCFCAGRGALPHRGCLLLHPPVWVVPPWMCAAVEAGVPCTPAD